MNTLVLRQLSFKLNIYINMVWVWKHILSLIYFPKAMRNMTKISKINFIMVPASSTFSFLSHLDSIFAIRDSNSFIFSASSISFFLRNRHAINFFPHFCSIHFIFVHVFFLCWRVTSMAMQSMRTEQRCSFYSAAWTHCADSNFDFNNETSFTKLKKML